MKSRTSDAVEILRRRVAGDPEMKALIAEARGSMERDSGTSKERIVQEIKHLSESLGKTPGRRDFPRETGISMRCVLVHFDSWNQAVEAAGLAPHVRRTEPSDLLVDWGTIVRRIRTIPTLLQYKKQGRFDPSTLERSFTRWSALPDAFREWAYNKPEWADVVALLPLAAPIAEDGSPAQSAGAVQDRPLVEQEHPRFSNRATYGNPTDFRGLRHEPVNEQGVVFLFGMVARELGYMVEAIQSGFPDCEAKRQIAPGKWQRVLIEFEYESRNLSRSRAPSRGMRCGCMLASQLARVPRRFGGRRTTQRHPFTGPF